MEGEQMNENDNTPKIPGLANRVVTPSEVGVSDMMPPHGKPGHKCSNEFMYEFRFSGIQARMMHKALVRLSDDIAKSVAYRMIEEGEFPEHIEEIYAMVTGIANQIADTIRPTLEKQMAAEARWEEFNVE